jgi:hypothetical protein
MTQETTLHIVTPFNVQTQLLAGHSVQDETAGQYRTPRPEVHSVAVGSDGFLSVL